MLVKTRHKKIKRLFLFTIKSAFLHLDDGGRRVEAGELGYRMRTSLKFGEREIAIVICVEMLERSRDGLFVDLKRAKKLSRSCWSAYLIELVHKHQNLAFVELVVFIGVHRVAQRFSNSDICWIWSVRVECTEENSL